MVSACDLEISHSLIDRSADPVTSLEVPSPIQEDKKMSEYNTKEVHSNKSFVHYCTVLYCTVLCRAIDDIIIL